MKDQGIIKDAYELILKEIQSLVTVLYLLMVGLGMLFNYQKYSEFGINIFEYADIFDFLIAPFEDIRIIIFSIFSLLVPLIFFRIDTFLESRFPKYYTRINFGLNKKSWFKNYRLIIFSGLFLFYFILGSNAYGVRTSKDIRASDKITVRFFDNDNISAQLIGKTSQYILLYAEKEVLAVPINSNIKFVDITNDLLPLEGQKK